MGRTAYEMASNGVVNASPVSPWVSRSAHRPYESLVMCGYRLCIEAVILYTLIPLVLTVEQIVRMRLHHAPAMLHPASASLMLTPFS